LKGFSQAIVVIGMKMKNDCAFLQHHYKLSKCRLLSVFAAYVNIACQGNKYIFFNF